jgi:hypothetical protein
MPRKATSVLWAVGVALIVLLGTAGLVVTAQGARFAGRVAAEARALWAVPAGPPARPVDPSALPPPVRRYAEVSGALRRPGARVARLRHVGSFRLGDRWRPIRGVQYLAADPPGFVWWGRVRLAPGVWVDGRDRSVAGEGNMLIVAASTWTLADARGPELDQGALVRLLGELTWLPGALVDPRYVTWAPRDARSARATLAVGGRAVEALFHFGPDGLPERFEAERHREVDGRSVLTPFVGHLADFRQVDGVRVPFRLEAAWVVDGREQPYARWEVERFELDRAEPFR